jgi:lipooligosaccharide transport system permease protein
MTSTTTAVRDDPVTEPTRAIEPAALRAVWHREWTLFVRYWRSTSFAALVEPLVYLFAFGVGFGSLVAFVGDVPYVQFLGTGIVASAVLFTSVFTGMFTTFVRRVFQRTYDALLAAPIDVHELVLAEAVWIAAKAGVYGCAPLLAAMLFGLPPTWGMLLVPAIGFLTGLGFALFGILTSAVVPTIDSFNYITSGVVTPLFLVSGTFFPLDTAPAWMQVLAWVNPLYHCVQLVRDAVFVDFGWVDLVHIGVLAGFAALMAVLAIRQMRRRLIG